ncbi:hypothetical protein PF008_g8924 [Phytophthora fragariae]|uniref:RxLR effector protein n=1 Tax=Phytophthora fragariae TaxID=53985 RepID=A0A6G0RY59_9STRA|nr:hypothetical protein PF008_g8924 [Phytophthora fragariae]
MQYAIIFCAVIIFVCWGRLHRPTGSSSFGAVIPFICLGGLHRPTGSSSSFRRSD